MSEKLGGRRFRIPPRVIFGAGALERAGEEAARWGNKVLVVTGRRAMRASGTLQRLLKTLEKASIEAVTYESVPPEPDLECLQSALEVAKDEKVHTVIGLGGGSALDVAKAVAGLFFAEQAPAEYFRAGKVEVERTLPFLAIPTTAGTGSEVTLNSVLVDRDRGIKASMRHELWLAQTVLADPELLASLPFRQAAMSGADALTHALESLVSTGANELTVPLSLQASAILLNNLDKLANEGWRAELQGQLMSASLLAGLAFSNAGLGLVHALAHPLGMVCHLPHGLACAALLQPVIRYNAACGGERYAQLVKLLELSSGLGAGVEALLEHLERLWKVLELPANPEAAGLRPDQVESVVKGVNRSGSYRFNCRPADEAELRAILEDAG